MSHLFVVIGLIAAFWVYQDAQKFGYSKNIALLWAGGTIFMVIVFLPLYLLLGRKPQMQSNRREEKIVIDAEAEFHDSAQDCPMCARKVQEDFKVCPYCGYTLQLSCAECGRDLRREWKVCPYCQTAAPEK